jgi:hypothetical protein
MTQCLQQLPDGKQSEQIETNLKDSEGVRESDSEEVSNQKETRTACDTLQKAKRDATDRSMDSLR